MTLGIGSRYCRAAVRHCQLSSKESRALVMKSVEKRHRGEDLVQILPQPTRRSSRTHLWMQPLLQQELQWSAGTKGWFIQGYQWFIQGHQWMVYPGYKWSIQGHQWMVYPGARMVDPGAPMDGLSRGTNGLSRAINGLSKSTNGWFIQDKFSTW